MSGRSDLSRRAFLTGALRGRNLLPRDVAKGKLGEHYCSGWKQEAVISRDFTAPELIFGPGLVGSSDCLNCARLLEVFPRGACHIALRPLRGAAKSVGRGDRHATQNAA